MHLISEVFYILGYTQHDVSEYLNANLTHVGVLIYCLNLLKYIILDN